jgi:tRNA G18 (ribose-2'-O)-methylase SpoU
MIEHLQDLDDPRLAPFKGMRTSNWTVGSGWFIAEGPRLVERLLRSSYRVHSLLVSDKYLEDWIDRIPAEILALVVPEEQIAGLLGFHFHRGVIACGLRKPPLDLKTELAEPLSGDATLVALYGVQDPENLGGILRSCAALGIEHILIGPRSADPLSRRVLRVSMGTVLKLNLYAARDLVEDLAWLRERHGARSIATTLADDSENLERAHRNTPLVVILGNEAYGLPIDLQQVADRRVKIDMRLGTDSLNVSVAAGIVLHYFCRVAAP